MKITKANVLNLANVFAKYEKEKVTFEYGYGVKKNRDIFKDVMEELISQNPRNIDKGFQTELDEKVLELSVKDDNGKPKQSKDTIEFGENKELFEEFKKDLNERYDLEIKPRNEKFNEVLSEEVELDIWKFDSNKLPEMEQLDIELLINLDIVKV